jgi:predicted esterase
MKRRHGLGGQRIRALPAASHASKLGRNGLPNFRLLLAALSFIAGPFLAQPCQTLGEKPSPLQTGVILPRVTAMRQPEQSYALYLPSAYSQDKLWPIIYAFDPGARGSVPVELMKEAAERNGYILVGSNNSRNGSWKIEAEAAEAIIKDTHARLSVDDRRVYFAGFSGGARVAAQIAQVCKCAAGVLLNGAGFHPLAFDSKDAPFVVFAAVGSYDFNYPELVSMDDELEKLAYPHFLLPFEGPHQWAPASAMEDALAWFRLQAMKSGREARDDSFIAAQAAKENHRARALEQSGNLYAAWKEYRQAARMLAGLADDAAFRARAEALEKDKAIRDGAKREKLEFEEQAELTREISAGLFELQRNSQNRAEIYNAAEKQLVALRSRAEHEKRQEKLRVIKRVLAGLLVQAMEMGNARLDQKDASHAKDYFELASVADPDSTWALGNLAVARAMEGDRKGTLDALRRAKSKTKDPVRFAEWLKEEPAFAKLRGSPEFSAILGTSTQH